MSKLWTVRRTTSIVLFVLAVAGATTGWLQPPAQALGCENGSNQTISWEWVSTAEAQAQSATLCAPNMFCRQWCFVSCEEVVPYPSFECFPN